MGQFLTTNLIKGLRTSPLHGLKHTILLFTLFAIVALTTGFSTGLFRFEVLDSDLVIILPFALFIFPALFEEVIFRGLLIPNNTRQAGIKKTLYYSMISSVVFVAWHPLNALTINPGAKAFFLDPWFLLITFVLGMVCSLGYIFSRSLWVPVIMHWLTVIIWVLLLGGRNLILQ